MPSVVSEPISIYDSSGVELLRRELRLDPQRVRRWRTSLLKRFLPAEEALVDFPADRLAVHALAEHGRFDSGVDGATKLLLRTSAGMLVEAVILRIATGRTTLCISCQVGCAAACRFCATGKMGVARPLSVAEILDQILRAGQILREEDRSLRNIVFMGMGEPFHNEENLYPALETLTSPEFFNHAPTKILVSTVGIPEAMVRFAERFPKINLALSLHSARQEVREQLIPLAKRYPLDALREAVAEVNRIQQKSVMIEYLMLADVNDGDEDARQLMAWIEGLDVHVNLIPFNAIDGAPELTASDRPRREAFAARLKAAGIKTTMRYSLGQDIEAACGQLVRRLERHPRGGALPGPKSPTLPQAGE
ncbi:23S rRNA (adenine(2503)-C(2))-methyltransferase RlmN [Candidatus Laterigemmans baculatus]|uniref:23S rRNA (adenine(2503)-C(2))-methyltransferase RlmN n=1 Tax=Candidatus Laterigemmans baculatus TaxID=2770505 RepID=UPI001F225878|nr:23S rRNA (adenine(2503)-C(2))-methyltransferase RlmN [Candidatus Laterigemmans baculatus]